HRCRGGDARAGKGRDRDDVRRSLCRPFPRSGDEEEIPCHRRPAQVREKLGPDRQVAQRDPQRLGRADQGDAKTVGGHHTCERRFYTYNTGSIMAESSDTMDMKEFQLHEKETSSADVESALLTLRIG